MKFVTCTIQQGCTQKIDGWQEGRHLHMVDAEEYTFPQHIDRNGQGHTSNNLHSPEYYRILRVHGHDANQPHVVDTDTGDILSCSSDCVMHEPRPMLETVEPPERMGAIKWQDSLSDVFRQCDNTECPAFRHGKPHSHIEREMLPPTTIDNAVSRLERLRDFTMSTIPLKPWQALTLTETNDALNVSPVEAWISIPLEGPHSADLMQKVGEYITWVETAMTKDVCKCEWILHPEKGNIRGGDTALDCPAHSKEGLVLGFFTWLRKNRQEPCGICSGRGCPDCDTAQTVRGEEIVSKAEHGD